MKTIPYSSSKFLTKCLKNEILKYFQLTSIKTNKWTLFNIFSSTYETGLDVN
jgi:hypothetical protein